MTPDPHEAYVWYVASWLEKQADNCLPEKPNQATELYTAALAVAWRWEGTMPDGFIDRIIKKRIEPWRKTLDQRLPQRSRSSKRQFQTNVRSTRSKTRKDAVDPTAN